MPEILIIPQAQVAEALDLDELFAALEAAFKELSAGRASVPPRVAAQSGDGLLAAMPGYVDGILEAKLVTLFSGNEGTGIPTHQGLIALFDEKTGTPLAVMDGTQITAARTGAASAVAARLRG